MEFWYKGALELAASNREREIFAVESLDLYLNRIDRFNPELNAIVVLDRETARDAARTADEALAAGRGTAPLHGVPMTVKESFDLAGHPSTFGRPDQGNQKADRDALAI